MHQCAPTGTQVARAWVQPCGGWRVEDWIEASRGRDGVYLCDIDQHDGNNVNEIHLILFDDVKYVLSYALYPKYLSFSSIHSIYDANIDI